MERTKNLFVEVINTLYLKEYIVLIVDNITLKLIDKLFDLTELGIRWGIYDVNLISNVRYPHRFSKYTHVIYFLQGNKENILSIIKDFSNYDELIYRSAHLLFTSRLDQECMKILANSKALPFIRSLFEVPLNYLLFDFNIILQPDISHVLKIYGLTNRNLVTIERKNVLLSPLLYRITPYALLAEIDQFLDNEIWRSLCYLPFHKAYQKFTDVYKSKYDTWADSIEAEKDIRKKLSLLNGNSFSKFQTSYNICVGMLNKAHELYKTVLPLYELQLDLERDPQEVSAVRIRTRLNYMKDSNDKTRLLIICAAFLPKLSLELGLDLSILQKISQSRCIPLPIYEKDLLYVTEYITANEVEDKVILSPKMLTLNEYIKNILVKK